MEWWYWLICIPALVLLVAFVCYKIHAHPPTWYEDMSPPEDFNLSSLKDEDKWWGEE